MIFGLGRDGANHMRKVQIVDDPRAQRCWLAVDVKSGEPVLRLHDRGLLERICRSLERKIVHRATQDN
jgi:hypothetical protein